MFGISLDRHRVFNRRGIIVAGAAMLLGACSVIPKGAEPRPEPVAKPAPRPAPGPTALPTDDSRHRVALLVPLSGTNGAVGQSIANATTMALLDTNADNLRITTYDTAKNARDAARRAIADGNKLILGPLMSDNISSVLAEARPANVPLISYSNDIAGAANGVYLLGHVPGQSIARTIDYARKKGASRFAALIPAGDYGARAEAAFRSSVEAEGGTLVAVESYDRGNTSIMGAGQRLKSRGGYDAVLIADGARLSIQAADTLRSNSTQLIGTELWSGESSLMRASALRGALFSAVSDARFRRFTDSYRARFDTAPYRISTLGYDSVLLALRVASNGWKPGRVFPVKELQDEGGFLGLDGAFRFGSNGVAERVMEVREVRNGSVAIVDAAPTRFDD
ncbi:penicillin-binding protein activator [Altererythrobacter aquiaggeris]|uniref:penicillin-binding protein activator n=1 Tax=Aestuarierythrobacter aquiaggeris TaxID=1898396 RepID=UPI003015E358